MLDKEPSSKVSIAFTESELVSELRMQPSPMYGAKLKSSVYLPEG